ncbi:uncharacterized protein HHUB_4174 (plasmid) [Halobacterium hubeiense]|uniref:Uncharacterized protein n=1 Tax=Halobacterium hubeiense TaxID=1407499 RepID=A0A0U5H7A1_9EURY|nr:hypothetical protein [Halobacterium hubeiense]CQH63743.1 uncharacterized protein HHUB_4174 [Halobacterium hubeiense]
MIPDRQIRVARWLKEEGDRKVIDRDYYYINDESEEEVRVYYVEIDGKLGADPPADVSFNFGPKEWVKSYDAIETEFESRDLQPLS